MTEFIPDPLQDPAIKVGTKLVDMLGGIYEVETVTDEYFDVRWRSGGFPIPEWLRRPGVIRYRWDEPCPLRPDTEQGARL